MGVKYLVAGAPDATEGIVHRLDKFDTKKGISSIQYAADMPPNFSAQARSSALDQFCKLLA